MLLSYKFPLFLVVFGVEHHLSPRLQNPTVVVLVTTTKVLNKVCLTVLTSVRITIFL